MEIDRRDALRAEYGEASSTFRMLTEIRFKLLAFLPLAAASAAAVLERADSVTALAFSLFGLVVTIGLVTYNARNDQIYDTLVGRLAAIERSLGLPDGAFANRPTTWLAVRMRGVTWNVDHGTAVATIYYSSIALWLFGALAALGETLDVDRRLAHVAALVLAAGLTWQGARIVKAQKKRVQSEMRTLARGAVELATSIELRDLANSELFVTTCAKLSGQKDEHIRARVSFLSGLDAPTAAHYVGASPGTIRGSQIVAAITDLPPEWLFDCATGRRRSVPLDVVQAPG